MWNQVSIINQFEGLKFDDTSTPITERYIQFQKAVAEVARRWLENEKNVWIAKLSWVTDESLRLREERDKKYLLAKTRKSREIWRKLNTSLNESYKSDELASI